MESSWLATVTCVCVYKHTDSESIGRRTRRAQSALLLVDPNRNTFFRNRDVDMDKLCLLLLALAAFMHCKSSSALSFYPGMFGSTTSIIFIFSRKVNDVWNFCLCHAIPDQVTAPTYTENQDTALTNFQNQVTALIASGASHHISGAHVIATVPESRSAAGPTKDPFASLLVSFVSFPCQTLWKCTLLCVHVAILPIAKPGMCPWIYRQIMPKVHLPLGVLQISHVLLQRLLHRLSGQSHG